MSYLEKLKSAGIEVSLSGARTGQIEIGGQVSDQQRKWIQDHKPELLAELSPAKREAVRLGVLFPGSRQKISYCRCLDCGFDSADGIRCRAGVQRTERQRKIRLCLHYSADPKPLTEDQETAIRGWLDHIGETQDFEIAKVLARCQGNSDALAYFMERAMSEAGNG